MKNINKGRLVILAGAVTALVATLVNDRKRKKESNK